MVLTEEERKEITRGIARLYWLGAIQYRDTGEQYSPLDDEGFECPDFDEDDEASDSWGKQSGLESRSIQSDVLGKIQEFFHTEFGVDTTLPSYSL